MRGLLRALDDCDLDSVVGHSIPTCCTMKCFLLLDRHVPREDLSVRDFPMRDEVMAWIRACEAGDLLPGLCAFVEKVCIVV